MSDGLGIRHKITVEVRVIGDDCCSALSCSYGLMEASLTTVCILHVLRSPFSIVVLLGLAILLRSWMSLLSLVLYI